MTGLIWSIFLAAVGILGIWLAGKRNLWGWAIGVGAQLLWIVYALVTVQYGFVLSALAYGFVYGRNFVRWWDDERLSRNGYARDATPRHWNGTITAADETSAP